MAIEYKCDICGAVVPLDTALKPVMIGDGKICDVCLTCGSKLEQGIKAQIGERLAPTPEQQQAAEKVNQLKDKAAAEQKPATDTDAITPPKAPGA